MKVTIFFKDKPTKEHFWVIETYACPKDNEFNVHKEDKTIRYNFEDITAITTKK